jgi:neural Wiskott-Aldrich syndrome protein
MPQSFADEFRSFPISPQLGESLERAHRFAREQSHRLVTLEHLLLALTEDSEATGMLEQANVDLGRLRADVSGYLGGLLDDMRAQAEADLGPDADLIRVLKAATTAAQQSRRRHIDGAIVLAAVVGDGKSAAAGLLKALGMTFEGAIRALQRANTQARVRAAPAAAAAAWAPATGPGRSAAPASADPALPPVAGTPQPTAEHSLATSAEEFLAAARSRIQQRAAAARGEKGAATAVRTPPAAAAAAGAEPAKPSSSALAMARTELNPQSLAAAISDVTGEPQAASAEHASGHRAKPAGPAGEPPPAAPGPAPSRTEPEPRDPPGTAAAPAVPGRGPASAPEPQPVSRAPQPASDRGALPVRPLRPAEGPLRPPLPLGPGAPYRAPPGLAPPVRGGRAARGANGAGPAPPSARPASPPTQPPMAAAGGAVVVPLQPRTGAALPSGGYAERGPLAENVPRRMRSGVPATAEVRIARDKIDGLILALCNRGMRPEVYPTRTLAVRLRAPNGGFVIEANAPETQWIDRSASNLSDNFAAWRWTITPQRRGRNRLLLTVSARLIGQDGLLAESAPSDRSIDVKIAGNYRQLAQRWGGWLAAMLAGAALAQFGSELWAAVAFLLRQASGS